MCVGTPPRDEQIAERLDDVGCLELPCHANGQALSGELIDDAQHPEHLSIMRAIRDEVVRPNMVRSLRSQADA